jgi:peptide/nickel transport system permease protein
VPPPTPSWGRSIGDAVAWFSTDPGYLIFPGGALFLITLGLNAFGDGLRDALDPRVNRKRSIRARVGGTTQPGTQTDRTSPEEVTA